MKDIYSAKISYYGQNRRVLLNNPRYKSKGRVKTKPTFNQLVNLTHKTFLEKHGEKMKYHDPKLYESLTGKKAPRNKSLEDPVIKKKENVKVEDNSDSLLEYQKKRELERREELERERKKQAEAVVFKFESPKKDMTRYIYQVNAFEPVNKGKLGHSQSWRFNKPPKTYY